MILINYGLCLIHQCSFVYNALITKGVHLYRQITSVAFVASSQEIALTPTDMLNQFRFMILI